MENITNVTSPDTTRLTLERRPAVFHLDSHLLGRIAAFCPGEMHSLSREATTAHLNNMVVILRKFVKENTDIRHRLSDLSLTALTPVNKDKNLYIESALVNKMFQEMLFDIYPLTRQLLGAEPSMGDVYNLLERKDSSKRLQDLRQKLGHSSKLVAQNLRGAPHNFPIPQGLKEGRSWFEGIVAGALYLSDVTTLDLSNKELRIFPLELIFLRNLERLNLSGNLLTNLPEFLIRLQSCVEIQLENNKISLGKLSPQLQDFLIERGVNLDELQRSQRIDAPEEGGGGGGKK